MYIFNDITTLGKKWFETNNICDILFFFTLYIIIGISIFPCMCVFFYCDMKIYGVHVCVCMSMCMVVDTLDVCAYYLLMR